MNDAKIIAVTQKNKRLASYNQYPETQDDFNKVHRVFTKALMNIDKEKREECYPLLFNLRLNYNKLCLALGIENHNTSNNEEVK